MPDIETAVQKTFATLKAPSYVFVVLPKNAYYSAFASEVFANVLGQAYQRPATRLVGIAPTADLRLALRPGRREFMLSQPPATMPALQSGESIYPLEPAGGFADPAADVALIASSKCLEWMPMMLGAFDHSPNVSVFGRNGFQALGNSEAERIYKALHFELLGYNLADECHNYPWARFAEKAICTSMQIPYLRAIRHVLGIMKATPGENYPQLFVKMAEALLKEANWQYGRLQWHQILAPFAETPPLPELPAEIVNPADRFQEVVDALTHYSPLLRRPYGSRTRDFNYQMEAKKILGKTR